MKSHVSAARALVGECARQARGSEAWTRAEGELNNSLWKLGERQGNPSLGMRVELFRQGAVAVASEVVRGAEAHTEEVVDTAWWVIAGAMVLSNPNDPKEYETVVTGVTTCGLLELAVAELSFRPLRAGGRFMSRAFTCLSSPVGVPSLRGRLLESGALDLCIAVMEAADVSSDYMLSVLDKAANVLAGLAMYNREALHPKAPTIVAACTPLLRYLDLGRALTFAQITLGFRSARLIIRLVGKDEASKAVRDNPAILDFYVTLMTRAMASGPEEGFKAFGVNWILSGIALDLALVAVADANKSLLVPHVPLVMRMLAEFGAGNAELLQHGLVFLSQVSFEEGCKAELVKGKARVEAIQKHVLREVAVGAETRALMGVIMGAVGSGSAPGAPGAPGVVEAEGAPRRLPGLFTRMATAKPAKPLHQQQQQQQHQGGGARLMISYNQSSSGDICRALVPTLEKRGMHVWVDFRDMKGDIQEAMARGVDSSDVVMVLATPEYKESANCRLECQYAFQRGKPLVFVMCNESYKAADGWLGLIMGQTLWVGVFKVSMVETMSGELVKRVNDALAPPEQAAMTTPSNNSSSGNAGPSSALSAQVQELRAVTDRLTAENAQLRAENAALGERLSRVEEQLARLA